MLSTKVSYTESQSLTSAQKLIAQTNIGLQNAALTTIDNSFVGQTINGHLTANLGLDKFYVNSGSGNLGGFTTTDSYISLKFTDSFGTSYLSWSGFDNRFTVNHSFKILNDLIVDGSAVFGGNVTALNFIGNVIGNQFTSSGGSVQIRNNAGQPIATFTDARTTSLSGDLSVYGKAYVIKSGSPSIHADTDMIVANSAAAGSTAQFQLLSGNNAASNFYFSDTDAYNVGGFRYLHATDTMYLRAAGLDLLSLSNTAIIANRNVISNAGFSTGINAANSGAIRLENSDQITSRNSPNSGNRTLLYLNNVSST